MQRANCLVSLGGDHGNTVPKNLCTAAEIAVLREIHGDDAVNEIEPVDDIARSNREERGRLLAIYGAAKYQDQKPIVESMFPGVAARVFETLDELELDESFFKPTGRLKARPVSAPVAVEEPAEEAPAFDADVVEDDEIEGDEGVGDDMNDDVAAQAAAEQARVSQERKDRAAARAAAKAAAEAAAKAAKEARAAKKKNSILD
jgi:hypothetical protein